MSVNTGVIDDAKPKHHELSITVKYDDWGFQCVSFPTARELIDAFPVGEKVTVFRDQVINGLQNSKGFKYMIPKKWGDKRAKRIDKKWQAYRRKEKERMMAIPVYRYESKYQFPDDIDIYGSKEDGEGFRNSTHLSVSRGMEFMEGKNLDDFSQREYKNIKGISKDNKNVEQLKDHINKCVMKELGSNWGHSGMSMIIATNHVLEAKKRGWDNYIEWIRSWPSKKEEENSK